MNVQSIWKRQKSCPFTTLTTTATDPSVRIQGLRLVYCVKNSDDTFVKRPYGPFQLTCETFVPIIFAKNKVERDSNVRSRLGEWTREYLAQIICIETSQITVLVGSDFISGLDALLHPSHRRLLRAQTDTQMTVTLQIYRVYYDGSAAAADPFPLTSALDPVEL